MQRFVPRIHVHQISGDGIKVRHFVASFPQTSFTAVTAYQNQEVKKCFLFKHIIVFVFSCVVCDECNITVQLKLLHVTYSYLGYRFKKTCLSLSLPMHLNSLRAKILKILNINKRINAKFKTSFIMYMYMARHNDVACSLDRTMQL